MASMPLHACDGYFSRGIRAPSSWQTGAVALIVRRAACLAEGLGIRATARVFEVDPNTVLHCGQRPPSQLRAFTSYFLCDMPVRQLHLTALCRVARASNEGESATIKRIKRLERSAIGCGRPSIRRASCCWRLSGPRTLTMAQRVVHQWPSASPQPVCPCGERRLQSYLPPSWALAACAPPERTAGSGASAHAPLDATA